jgi:hypothetical protein
MIVISDSVVTVGTETDPRNPRVGWHSLVTPDNVFSDEAEAGHPVSLLGNPATYLYWKGETTSAQTVGVQLSTAATVNYVGLARHNLGSTGAQYIVEASGDGSSWTQLTEPRIPIDDRPLIHEFDDEFASWFRLSITPDADAPEIGVMYFGDILRLQRRIYVGHTPITYGRETTVSTGYSEEGQFLGRVVRRRMYKTSVSMQNITPDWYRSEMDPFFESATERPFFFAWRPSSYPNETGFAWLTRDPSMVNARPNGMVDVEFQMQGIR